MSLLKGKKFIRIFFATDVHGSTLVLKKFLNTGDVYAADVLVLGGDVTGKLIVPITHNGDGTYHASFMEQDWSLKAEELDSFLIRVENAGFYPYQTTKDDWDGIASSEKYEDLYSELAAERIRKWISIAGERFKNNNRVVYLTGGNDDPPWFKGIFGKEDRILNVDEELVDIFGVYQMISLGYSNRTPWKTPREMDEQDLAAKIDGLVAKATMPYEKCIFNFHVPPYGTGLDTCPMVDGSVSPPKYVFKGGQPVQISGGSTAVKQAIEHYQPALGLHGHVHEQRGAIKIGRTWCVNPGSEYGEGVLRGVLVNLDSQGKGVLSYQFTGG